MINDAKPKELRSLQDDSVAHAWRVQQSILPEGNFQALRPDFLIISPPKTGSTWLARNLGCHPDLFVPEVKEIKYFSSWYKWFDLHWYLEHFSPAVGKVKGEASPSYSILPTQKIQLIRSLFPAVKLIFLMREPVSRAWSHAKHSLHYREANFVRGPVELDSVTEEQWRENFSHDWTLAHGDYLGQLRRWLAVFPKEQVFVGFYESIARSPENLLRDLFAFLGVDRSVSLASFPIRERIQLGLSAQISESQRHELHRILHQRTVELAAYLGRELNLSLPTEWLPTIGSPASGGHAESSIVFRHEQDDDFLKCVNALEEHFPASTKSLLRDYRGFHIVFHDSRFYALDETLGRVCPSLLTESDVQKLERDRRCFSAGSLQAVKEAVDRLVYEQARTSLTEAANLRSELVDARQRLTILEALVAQHSQAVRQAQSDLRTIGPWLWLANKLLRRVWKKLRSTLAALARRRRPRRIPGLAAGMVGHPMGIQERLPLHEGTVAFLSAPPRGNGGTEIRA